MSDLVTLYTTCGSEEEALKIARALVEARLAACGNVYPGVKSVYEWQGEIRQEAEVGLILKTRRARADAAMAMIEQLHSYDQPGIEIWPVEAANKLFAEWIEAQTTGAEGE